MTAEVTTGDALAAGSERADVTVPFPLPQFFDRVYALRSVETCLAAESERMVGVETGGVLVGFVDSRRNAIVITAASGPGPAAKHGRFSFNRDRAFCQAFLDQHASMTGGVIDFIGEWHKHPESDPRPSNVDVDTYRCLARNPSAHVDRPLVVITGTTAAVAVGANAARAAWLYPTAVPPGIPRRVRRIMPNTPSPARVGNALHSATPEAGGEFGEVTDGGQAGRQVIFDRYKRANAFVFRADGYKARTIQWLPDDAYADLLRDPAAVLGDNSSV